MNKFMLNRYHIPEIFANIQYITKIENPVTRNFIYVGTHEIFQNMTILTHIYMAIWCLGLESKFFANSTLESSRNSLSAKNFMASLLVSILNG